MLNPSNLVAEKNAARQLLREANRHEMPIDACTALEELVMVIDKTLTFTAKGVIPAIPIVRPPQPPSLEQRVAKLEETLKPAPAPTA